MCAHRFPSAVDTKGATYNGQYCKLTDVGEGMITATNISLLYLCIVTKSNLKY